MSQQRDNIFDDPKRLKTWAIKLANVVKLEVHHAYENKSTKIRELMDEFVRITTKTL